MSDSIGHEILNHLGKKITVTAQKLRALDKNHFLMRDRESGLLQFKPDLTRLYLEMGPDHELGPDFSGPNVCDCRCKQCTDKLRSEDWTSNMRVSGVVREVTAQRRYA